MEILCHRWTPPLAADRAFFLKPTSATKITRLTLLRQHFSMSAFVHPSRLRHKELYQLHQTELNQLPVIEPINLILSSTYPSKTAFLNVCICSSISSEAQGIISASPNWAGPNSALSSSLSIFNSVSTSPLCSPTSYPRPEDNKHHQTWKFSYSLTQATPLQ